jgi:flagellar hook protein FlgE
MAVFGALSIGRTGLINQSAALSVIGNNIANVSTTGFKGSRVEFADLLSAAGGGAVGKIGLGSRIGAIRTVFDQGAIENTGREKDLAIQGEGFFLVGDPENPLFTRAGNFTSDRDGNIVTTQGDRLLAFPVSQATGQAVGRPEPINIGGLSSQAQATANVTLAANLDAQGFIPPGGFDPTSFTTAFATSTHATSVAVYDSLGGVHNATIFFTRTGVNAWRYDVAFDAGEIQSPAPGALGPGDPMIIGDGTITFNPDGTLASVTPANPTTLTFTGTNPQTITFGFGTVGDTDGLSQNAGTFALRFQSQDGFGIGELLGVNFSEDGFVEALFSNGQTRVINQLALARFANNEGLQPLGNQLYRPSVDSGEPIVDVPLSGGRGSIVGGALEGSNVSIAQQFIDLISAQRSFQANTRIITSSDQLLSELINIVR